MTAFARFNDDGEIISTGQMPTEMIELQQGNIYVGDADRQFNYIADGRLETYTSSELQVKNNLPQGWVWKMPERVAVDMRSLEDAKDQAWRRVKTARAVAETAPFAHDGATYDADRERISGAVQLALLAQLSGQPFSINWTLADNAIKTHDAAQMIAVGAALGARVGTIYDAARALRKTIELSVLIAELDAIAWATE